MSGSREDKDGNQFAANLWDNPFSRFTPPSPTLCNLGRPFTRESQIAPKLEKEAPPADHF